MRKLLLAGALLSVLAIPAKADILGGIDWNIAGATVLQLEATVPSGNQVNNLPCIICGANQPQQPTGFGYNLFGNTGNADTVAFFSTSVVPTQGGSGLAIDQYGGDSTGYAIGDGSIFRQLLIDSLTFSIGIDVNDTNVAQTLESFWFLNYTTKTVLAVYSPNPFDGTVLPDINNGTGFPDWTLTGLTLAGINQGDLVGFFARVTGANDGPDSFFIQPGQFAVPGPALGAGLPALVGLLGLFGLNRLRRRRLA
jgi:hypothetical protein